MKNSAKYIFSTIAGAIVNLLSGWEVWLASMVILMVADVVVGIIKVVMYCSDKKESGGLSFKRIFLSGLKKILVLILIALGALLDQIVSPENQYIRSTVAAYYIANEIFSILENVAACGIPLPQVLYFALDALKNGKKTGDSNPQK